MIDNIDEYSIEIDVDTILQDFDDADEQQYELENISTNDNTDILFE